jgi:adenine-specific DNA-methyltransferase
MLYPKPHVRRAIEGRPELLRETWSVLNALDPEKLLGEGRVYGGGLHKMEPKELGNASAEGVVALLTQPSGEPQLF